MRRCSRCAAPTASPAAPLPEHNGAAVDYFSMADDPDMAALRLPISHVLLWAAARHFKARGFTMLRLVAASGIFPAIEGFGGDYASPKELTIAHFKTWDRRRASSSRFVAWGITTMRLLGARRVEQVSRGTPRHSPRASGIAPRSSVEIALRTGARRRLLLLRYKAPCRTLSRSYAAEQKSKFPLARCCSVLPPRLGRTFAPLGAALLCCLAGFALLPLGRSFNFAGRGTLIALFGTLWRMGHFVVSLVGHSST